MDTRIQHRAYDLKIMAGFKNEGGGWEHRDDNTNLQDLLKSFVPKRWNVSWFNQVYGFSSAVTDGTRALAGWRDWTRLPSTCDRLGGRTAMKWSAGRLAAVGPLLVFTAGVTTGCAPAPAPKPQPVVAAPKPRLYVANESSVAAGSWGGRRLSLAPYVTETGATRGTTATGGG
jgi:hypothetical protein